MSWRYGANNKTRHNVFKHIISSWNKWRFYSSRHIQIPPVVSCIFIFAEDILDEVSGLTVNSPNETMEEGPQLPLQSPGGHQEDKISMGTGQKVGCTMYTHRYDYIVCAWGSELVFQQIQDIRSKSTQNNVSSRSWAKWFTAYYLWVWQGKHM